MAINGTTATESEIIRAEHDDSGSVGIKRVGEFGWDSSGLQWVKSAVNSSGNPIVTSGLAIPAYDYISLTYTGDNITGVVYKTGGSGGTTVATLAITYSGSNITSVTKT